MSHTSPTKSLKTSNEHLQRSPSSESAKKQKVEETNGEKAGLSWEYFPTKVDYTTIYTKDMAASKEFLSKAFGFKVTMDTENWMELKPQHVNANDATTVGVHPIIENKQVSGDVRLVISVKDLPKFHEHLVQLKNVEVVIKPTKEAWGSKAEYIGPAGLKFAVMELPAEGTKGNGICWLDIPCEDLVRAKKFYGEAFGWTFKDHKDDYALFETNSKDYTVRGGLAKESNKSHRINVPVMYLFTTDIPALLTKIKSLGGEIVKPETSMGNGGYHGHFKDTEGNLMSLYTHKGSI